MELLRLLQDLETSLTQESQLGVEDRQDDRTKSSTSAAALSAVTQHGSNFSGANTVESGNIYQIGNIRGDVYLGKIPC